MDAVRFGCGRIGQKRRCEVAGAAGVDRGEGSAATASLCRTESGNRSHQRVPLYAVEYPEKLNNLNVAPYWNVLPKAQATLWERFLGLPEHFVLYGGTALALQLGHRNSVDFDFFSAQPIAPRQLYETLDFLAKGRITQEERNTLTVQANTKDGPVYVSFFGGLGLRCVDLPTRVPPGVSLAGVRDIFGCKCAAIQQRESLKDLQDICALLRHGLSLVEGLGCSRAIYGNSFNPRITLMALSYPPALEGLPEEDRQLLAQAVGAIHNVPAVAVEPLGRIGEVEPVQSREQTMDASSNAVAEPK